MLLSMMLLSSPLALLALKTSEPPVPWLTVKLLIVPPSTAKTLLTVRVLALFAWLPLNVPLCRLNAPLLKKELTVSFPLNVMAAVVELTASSPAPGMLPLLQCEGLENQSATVPSQLTVPARAAETLSRDRKPSPRPAALRRERKVRKWVVRERLVVCVMAGFPISVQSYPSELPDMHSFYTSSVKSALNHR